MSNDEYDSEYIKVESILYALAKSFSEIQRAIDKKSLDLAQEFLEFNNVGFSLKNNCMTRFLDSESDNNVDVLPLLSMISLHRYQISELVVEFAITEKDHYSDKPHDQNSYYLVSTGEQTLQSRAARIKIMKKEYVCAEFQIDGEIKESLVL